MEKSVTTRFSKETSVWYGKWLEQNTYDLEPPSVEIVRIPIVGMRHRGIPEDMTLDGPLVLEADPNNEFDPKAIKVLYLDEQIGFIPRKSTSILHSQSFRQEGEDLSVLPKVISGNELFVYVISEK